MKNSSSISLFLDAAYILPSWTYILTRQYQYQLVNHYLDNLTKSAGVDRVIKLIRTSPIEYQIQYSEIYSETNKVLSVSIYRLYCIRVLNEVGEDKFENIFYQSMF
jgi:hypothetical protein